jgi:hypothetical protein
MAPVSASVKRPWGGKWSYWSNQTMMAIIW